ncbi:MAG: hypothetical protein ACKO3N_12315, partial [Verrucomicrobiota bacterium]
MNETPVRPATRRRSKWGWFWRLGLGLLAALVLLVTGRGWWAFRDRFPGYEVALRVDPAAAAAAGRPFQAGFGRRKITPDISDPARPVWLAGFSQNRPALAVHDDLWAMAAVLDDGVTRFGLVVLDSIGFFHDDVVRVRQAVPKEWGLAYVVVCSTHNHSTPDLMGLWGPSPVRSGVDVAYRDFVVREAVAALGEAVAGRQPARMTALEIPTPPEGLVADTRRPQVFDADLRVLHFTSPADGKTLGTLVGWGNHPETPWAGNQDLTADFPGVLRDSLEQGVVSGGQVRLPGLGGTHVFVNGAVGGLMTTHPNTTVRDPFSGEEFRKPSHEKTRALGSQLARRVLDRLLVAPKAPEAATVPIGIQARTIRLSLDNPGFLVAGLLGILNRGHSAWREVRTEVALITVGEASMLCVPGEIYPEIVNGGVVKAEGADFGVDPVEVPPLRELMPGRVKFVFGLANDEIGYIVPKSQWDARPPHPYHDGKKPYGEVNSMGPETGPRLHAELA